MSTPDEIRIGIEQTRGELGSDVDALADKVSPSAIAHRQTERVKSRFQDARESVMGVASSAKDSVSSAGGGAAGTAKAKAKGNPLAVGLIAFGAGWLASALFPASAAEEDIAGELKDRAEPLVDKAKEQAKDVGSNLGQSAKEHAQDLASSAKDSAQSVKDDAQGAASDVQDSAQSAASDVQSS
jgi:hypothetical protein